MLQSESTLFPQLEKDKKTILFKWISFFFFHHHACVNFFSAPEKTELHPGTKLQVGAFRNQPLQRDVADGLPTTHFCPPQRCAFKRVGDRVAAATGVFAQAAKTSEPNYYIHFLFNDLLL